MKEIKPYSVYVTNNTVVVALSTGHKLPYLADHLASQASGVGVDITDPKSYDLWEDAVLCWNVLGQRHEFHHPSNLKELNHRTDGYIPFDHATGSLRAVLSLLKFAQDKLYENPIFETTLKMVEKTEIKTTETQMSEHQTSKKHIGSTLESFLEEEGISKQVEVGAIEKIAQLDREQLLDSVGDFTWDFGQQFFVETEHGNFIWSDPDYNGDNSFTKYEGTYKDWMPLNSGRFGRSKGKHIIRSYCGDQIVVK